MFHLFPFSEEEDECSHSDDTNTKKHVVFNHCHKLVSGKWKSCSSINMLYYISAYSFVCFVKWVFTQLRVGENQIELNEEGIDIHIPDDQKLNANAAPWLLDVL